ncbi:MAG TPA: hypothetical protein PKY59_09240 [Pyrinomonadaceae bacterium]|nr:hypothetical protein [Pyrinomonadaceae bacterium]
MKHKFFALFAVCLLVLGSVGTTFADTKGKKTKKQTNELVALLPASDGVVTVNIKKLLNNALPQILSTKKDILADINEAILDIKQGTGIDLRQFDQFAAGFVVTSTTQEDYQPIAIVRGQYSAGGLLGMVKIASSGNYKTETIGGKNVYVFSAKEAAEKNKPNTNNAKADGMLDKLIAGLGKEIAVTAFDDKTIVFGTVPRVRQMLETKTSVSLEVSNLINRSPDAVMSFAGKTPNGMSALLPLDNDELGKSIDSIRYLYGSMNVVGVNTTVQLMAKTTELPQAEDLYQTLQGLQMLGKAFLGSAKGADKEVYARMIENAVIKRANNEVSLELSVPQSDLDIVMRSINITKTTASK